jgi:hypothetical protein
MSKIMHLCWCIYEVMCACTHYPPHTYNINHIPSLTKNNTHSYTYIHTHTGFLQVSFQYIDPSEPDKRFWFMIDVDENSAYQVETSVCMCEYMCV